MKESHFGYPGTGPDKSPLINRKDVFEIGWSFHL